jgi:hypothetical protein
VVGHLEVQRTAGRHNGRAHATGQDRWNARVDVQTPGAALLEARLGKEDGTRYYRKSLENYRSAMIEAGATGLSYYWSATQWLALQAVQDLGRDLKTYELARGLAIGTPSRT